MGRGSVPYRQNMGQGLRARKGEGMSENRIDNPRHVAGDARDENYNAYERDSDGGLLYVGGVVDGRWDEDAPERVPLCEGDAPAEIDFPDGPEGNHVEYYHCVALTCMGTHRCLASDDRTRPRWQFSSQPGCLRPDRQLRDLPER